MIRLKICPPRPAKQQGKNRNKQIFLNFRGNPSKYTETRNKKEIVTAQDVFEKQFALRESLKILNNHD